MAKGYLLFVLHAHLPYVRHPEYDRFLEERWFFEAVTETYIPLIKFFDRLHADRVPFKLTLSVSPTLANMMEDPLLQERCLRHIALSSRLAEREIERTRHWPDLNFLAQMYRRLFEEARQTFTQRCGMSLLNAFKEHARAGHLELITCGATHGFLPALSTEPAAVRAQVFSAVREHERIFGQKPQGFWLPECGYYAGLEKVLAQAGLRYFLMDTHGLEHAEPRPAFGVHAPIYCPNGVAAFGRCPATSRLVWSSKVGYPADPNYREYYHDIGFELEQGYLAEFQYAEGVRSHTGIKYHSITGPSDNKRLYNPDAGRQMAERHAHDFVGRCRDQLARMGGRMPFPGVIVSPYDAELFGHWWFEGPQWLHYVLRAVAQSSGLRRDPEDRATVAESGGDMALSTPGEYLSAFPVQQQAAPAPSSWGRNGYGEQWLNTKTEWLWRPLHEAAARMALHCSPRSTQRAQRTEKDLVHQKSESSVHSVSSVSSVPSVVKGSLEERALRQAGRELLLAQSSDWPFMITNGTTEQYAKRRFNDHVSRFHYLLNSVDKHEVNAEKLAALEHMDAVFPELDTACFAAQGESA